VQDDVAATPAVHALIAQVPAEQSRLAVGPAVQSCDAAPPPVQSMVPGAAQPPATPLPDVQAPDPLAVAPNGTRIGDAYVGLVLAPSRAMCNPLYFAIGPRYRFTGGAVKPLGGSSPAAPAERWVTCWAVPSLAQFLLTSARARLTSTVWPRCRWRTKRPRRTHSRGSRAVALLRRGRQTE